MSNRNAAGRTLAAAVLVLSAATAARADFVLYNGSLNTTPNAQGWLYLTNPLFGSSATQAAGGGVTVLDTMANTSDSAGYFSTGHPLVGTLDRNAGFTVTFRLKLDQESHTRPDRAGFSVIVLGSDAKGIELGFWQDEVWAQSSSPLFTHAEGALYNTTTALTDYAVTVLGNTYTVDAGGSTILTGAVRDYSAFGLPYTSTNFIFFGDNTSSAAARTQIARVTLAAVPEPSTWTLLSVGGLALLIVRGRGRARTLSAG